jgi:hypothetical protein
MRRVCAVLMVAAALLETSARGAPAPGAAVCKGDAGLALCGAPRYSTLSMSERAASMSCAASVSSMRV